MALADWLDLISEFDEWAEHGAVATLWWRDDDAIRPSPQLERLLAFAGQVPISLAVIPAGAEPSLAQRLGQSTTTAVLQHGWRHTNHAAPSGYSEFPPGRPVGEVGVELEAGRARLIALFGERALPIFVPPFHGFDDRFLPLLAAHQITSLSRLGPRRAAAPEPGVTEVNVHVSLFNWQTRRFGGIAEALTRIIQHLRGRREGTVDAMEPTGILTHHLVQDTASYKFLEQLVLISMAHPGARWLDAYEAFGLSPAPAALPK